MNPLNIFKWPFGARMHPPKSKTVGLDFRAFTTVLIVVLIAALLLGLVLLLYSFIAKTRLFGGGQSDTQESLMFGNLNRKQLKRWKPKKVSKRKKKKAQRLEEANRKWHEMYGSDNSDYEEKEDLQAVRFGMLEITGVKKVSFRDIIKDVYLIENKEEMKRIEQLRKLGYDVTIGSNQPSACDISREHAPKDTYREDFKKEHISPTQLLYSSFDRHENAKEEEDVLPKRLHTSNLKEESSLTVDKEGLLNHTLDEKEKVLHIGQLNKTSV